MAAKLDFQGIVDLVGDKLREVFGSEDMSIRWWDPEADTIEVVYVVEHGERLPKGPPRPVGATDASTRRLLHEGVGAYFGSHEEQAAAGIAGPQPGTDWCLSIIGAPIRGTQRVLGMIVIENHQREHAYGEADLRVLTTIGATMGTALENARLFDETQRLLKETEQRNAELAVIASVQQGIAAELDLQAIIDLVGDKLREVFATGDIGIWWWDAERRQGHSSYVFEHGVRHHHEPYTVKPGEVWERLFDGRETLLVHNRAESIAIGMHALEGTDQSLSALLHADHRRRPRARQRGARRLRARERLRAGRGAAARHGGREHGHGAGERAPVRRDAAAVEGDRAPRARIDGAVRGRPRPVIDARPGDGDGPHRRPRQGAAGGAEQRHLPARRGRPTLPRDRGAGRPGRRRSRPRPSIRGVASSAA